MDRTAAYTLCFSFPFNKETSGLYSDNDTLKMQSIDSTLNVIEIIISSHGFISLESIMKYFELRPTRHCPGIFFTGLDNAEIEYDEINRTDVITLWLTNEFRLRHTLKENSRPMNKASVYETIKKNNVHALDFNFSGKSSELEHAEKEEEPECQTGQKETSESEENEKT